MQQVRCASSVVRIVGVHRVTLALALALLVLAPRAQADTSAAPGPPQAPESAGKSGIAIDDANPEASVPDPEWARKHPMEMGYLLMTLADRAERAEQAGEFLKAARYYRALGEAVPDRAVSFGKACRAYEAAGAFGEAVDSCRQALGKVGVTVEDHQRFVRVSLQLPGVLGAEQVADIDAVLARLQSEVKDVPTQEAVGFLRCDVGLRLEQVSRLQECVASLQTLGVTGARLLAYDWSLALLKGDVERAQALLDGAATAGVPAESIQAMQQRLDQARAHAPTAPGVPMALWFVFAPLLVLCVMLAARTRARPDAAA